MKKPRRPSSANPVTVWREAANAVRAAGLGMRIADVPRAAKPYDGAARAHDPTLAQLKPHLPAAFATFTEASGYPAIDLGRGLRWAMLPPTAMRQVTGAMGDPAQPFTETRKLREAGTYSWPFAFFAGFDLSDVNGWCFAPPEGGGDPVVWLVEDSLPREEVGTFEDWVVTEAATITNAIAKPRRAALIEALREDGELASISWRAF
jgi:hypothetical protein